MKIFVYLFFLIMIVNLVYSNKMKNDLNIISNILINSNSREVKNFRLPNKNEIKGSWLDPFWTNDYRKKDQLNIDLPPYVLKAYLNDDNQVDYFVILIDKMNNENYAAFVLISLSNNYTVDVIDNKRRGAYFDMGFFRLTKEEVDSYRKYKYPVLNDWVKYTFFQTAEMNVYINNDSRKLFISEMW